MAQEQLGPPVEGEQGVSPVQTARNAVNRGLLGREYTGSALVTDTVQLHNVLIESGAPAQQVYDEVLIVTRQGVERAELFEDPQTAASLRQLIHMYELTRESIASSSGARSTRQTRSAQAAQPTQTESLPPMTAPKSPEARIQRRARQPTSSFATSEEPKPNEGTNPEENFGTFLKDKRGQAGLSQKAAGEVLGLKQPQVSQVELGRGSLSREHAAELLTQLGLDEQETEKYWNLYNQRYGEPQQNEQ